MGPAPTTFASACRAWPTRTGSDARGRWRGGAGPWPTADPVEISSRHGTEGEPGGRARQYPNSIAPTSRRAGGVCSPEPAVFWYANDRIGSEQSEAPIIHGSCVAAPADTFEKPHRVGPPAATHGSGILAHSIEEPDSPTVGQSTCRVVRAKRRPPLHPGALWPNPEGSTAPGTCDVRAVGDCCREIDNDPGQEADAR